MRASLLLFLALALGLALPGCPADDDDDSAVGDDDDVTGDDDDATGDDDDATGDDDDSVQPGDDDDGGTGCSCSSTDRDAPVGLLGLLLLAGTAVRRRLR